MQLCGVRTENWPQVSKLATRSGRPAATWAMAADTDRLAIGREGDVWVMNNWQDIDCCFGVPPEVLSNPPRRPGRRDLLWLAKTVRAPRIGPARGYQ
jgi:hypothetical protein